MPRQLRSKVYSGLTIAVSSGSIESLATILGTTDWPTVDDHVNKHQIVRVRITASADFYYGPDDAHADKALADVSVVPTWEREGNANLIIGTYVRSVSSAITGVVVEISYGV